MKESILKYWLIAFLVVVLKGSKVESQLSLGLIETIPFELTPQPDGTLSGFVNRTLDSAEQDLWTISASSCSNESVLGMEAWWENDMPDSNSALTTILNNWTISMTVTKGVVPFAVYNASTQWWNYSPNTALIDYANSVNGRNYSQIQAIFGMNRLTFGANNSNLSNDWYILMLNTIVAESNLRAYYLRVTCSNSPSCPSPTLDMNQEPEPQCSEHGACQSANSSSQYTSVVPYCACSPGFGGSGCEFPIEGLLGNSARSFSGLKANEMQYFDFTVPRANSSVIAELTRSRGDPILVMKSNQEGLSPSDVPQRIEIKRFGDLNSWRDRSDNAQITRMNVTANRFFIAVYNNPSEIVQDAVFNLTLRYSPPGQNICPYLCNGNGICTSQGTCVCYEGWGGEFCQGPLSWLPENTLSKGVLRPGQWRFYQYRPDNINHPVQIDFSADGGHSILLAGYGFYPTYASNSFILRSNRQVGQTTQELSPSSLRPGTMTFAIYDMDFFIHEPFNFSIRANLKSGPDTKTIVTAAATTVGGVVIFALIVVCVLYKCGSFRGQTSRSQRSPPQRSRHSNDQRMDPSELEFLRKHITSAGPHTGDDCTICVQDIEPGERVYHLDCKHTFHAKYECLERWLLEYSNRCPICNRELGRSRSQVKEGLRQNCVEMQATQGSAQQRDENSRGQSNHPAPV